MGDVYLSEYEERISRTPKESSRWTGKRGESECKAISPETQAILDKHKQQGVRYSDGIPDFSPFSESTVTIDKMTGARTSERTKLVDKNNAFGRAESYHYKTKVGNYNQADMATAKAWTASKRNGHEWSARDVELYRKQNSLTWHECNDGKTMMLIPTRINSEFTHLGGTSEAKKKNNIENLATQFALRQSGKAAENNAFRAPSENKRGDTKIKVISKNHR